MPKQIIIAEQHRIAAVFSEDQIQELIVAQGTHQVSDIYLGIVENVLAGIDAAFVNIGDSERNGFIHVSDLGPLKLRRAAGSITELLAPQQKVLVQVMKEPTGNKGPRLTGNISLPGRYLVLMPYGRGVNLSRRIRNENERNRLRALAVLIKPAGMGLVVRTEADGMPEDAIIEDLEALQRQWEEVQQETATTRAPALLNRDDDFIQRVLRDVYSADVNRIVVDSPTGLKRVKQQLTTWGGSKLSTGVLIDQHRDRIPVLEYFRVNAAIREALKPRVDLPSGGYIIIERTEALTVIDVNSGSFTRSATARETVLWTNCEAATEIARQLRLRNIAGVIIVDFIDMDSRRDQLQLLEHFNKALRADKARPQIAQLSELGLVELTRKRQGKNIYELFGRPCSSCGGLGHLVHLPGETETEGGEPVERPAAITLREQRTADIRGFWEDRSEEGEDDHLEELTLSHPSYQDASGSSRRRRRRLEEVSRGRPLPAARGVEPGDGELGTGTESFPRVGRGGRPERGRGRGRDRGNVRDGAILETGEITPALEYAGGQGVTPTPSIPEERRSRQRDHRPPVEPPEVIAVEMTPEEQDVYAWMGISPLILANREVKNPRNTRINIFLPGEAPPESTVTATVIGSSGAIAAEVGDQDPIDNGAEFEKEPLNAFATLIEGEDIVVSDADQSGEAENGSHPVTRRRRRRSSATMDD